MILWTTRPRA